ncbi:hypothetical protein K3495_g3865 [Podosphaera aphanis]|nr:hypothetical protein K3495_g3865 [Podosphaera aphanis]
MNESSEEKCTYDSVKTENSNNSEGLDNLSGVPVDKMPTTRAQQWSGQLHSSKEIQLEPLSDLDLVKDKEVLKLSAAELEERTSTADSLPKTSSLVFHSSVSASPTPSPQAKAVEYKSDSEDKHESDQSEINNRSKTARTSNLTQDNLPKHEEPLAVNQYLSSSQILLPHSTSDKKTLRPKATPSQKPSNDKAVSSESSSSASDLNYNFKKQRNNSKQDVLPPIHSSIPLPIAPISIPTYLQLELSSKRPSPLYIYRSPSSEYPYESSRIKYQRLLNFISLPLHLEPVLIFGTFACLDAWLHTFTILPLRFLKAAGILGHWWGLVLVREACFISEFIYHGSGRMWHRRHERPETSQTKSGSEIIRPKISKISTYLDRLRRLAEVGESRGETPNSPKPEKERLSKREFLRKHRRTKSQPSSLSSHNKADLLQGAIVIFSCIILMKLDASRMYHYIRGQAAIKLYVIFNVLEVGDKLLAALGQDIFECLFSNEILERDHNGRSKIIRPFLMFVLALVYNISHAAALFFQVITLNVAVNSYSNALFTLLMSNQFVEIKSTVFKRIEKDNLFQLTCADVVERFQLWLILLVIALRNIVEMGGLSMPGEGTGDQGGLLRDATMPPRSSSILPNSFTILPSWTGEILSPFFLVLGSETIVDWIKHCYISKFNNVKPAIYERYYDILAKDYYTNVFIGQNLVKRLGLPVMPLACLFIRSSVQTYHMLLATHLPSPIPSSATELTVESATSSPATTAALEHFDTIILRALGRSTFGDPTRTASNPWYLPSTDDIIAALTMVVFFLGAYLVLLVCKLVLGMVLLHFARNRYHGMKQHENKSYDTDGKRLGAWGMTEVDDEKRRWIYRDDPEKLQQLAENSKKAAKDRASAGPDFGKISRYEMLKRIW